MTHSIYCTSKVSTLAFLCELAAIAFTCCWFFDIHSWISTSRLYSSWILDLGGSCPIMHSTAFWPSASRLCSPIELLLFVSLWTWTFDYYAYTASHLLKLYGVVNSSTGLTCNFTVQLAMTQASNQDSKQIGRFYSLFAVVFPAHTSKLQ